MGRYGLRFISNVSNGLKINIVSIQKTGKMGQCHMSWLKKRINAGWVMDQNRFYELGWADLQKTLDG